MKNVTALFLGDLIGQPGCRAVFFKLPSLIKKVGADFVVVNAENAADGFGLLPEQAQKLFEAGADVITTGNHIWQRKEIFPLLDDEPRLLRPGNYPQSLPGHGFCVVAKNGLKWAVMNFQGRTHMALIDDPFSAAAQAAAKLKQQTPLILVDFHAEAMDEKEAFGLHLDGKVSAVVGTHTHIATADEKILPGGTAYQSDLGMCGPALSVIGSDPKLSIERAVTQIPHRPEILDQPADLRGAVVTLDPQTGRALSIYRIHETA